MKSNVLDEAFHRHPAHVLFPCRGKPNMIHELSVRSLRSLTSGYELDVSSFNKR